MAKGGRQQGASGTPAIWGGAPAGGSNGNMAPGGGGAGGMYGGQPTWHPQLGPQPAGPAPAQNGVSLGGGGPMMNSTTGGSNGNMAPSIGGLSPSQIQAGASAPAIGGMSPAQVQAGGTVSSGAPPGGAGGMTGGQPTWHPQLGAPSPGGAAPAQNGQAGAQQSPLAGLLGQFAHNPQMQNSPLMGLLSQYFGH